MMRGAGRLLGIQQRLASKQRRCATQGSRIRAGVEGSRIGGVVGSSGDGVKGMLGLVER